MLLLSPKDHPPGRLISWAGGTVVEILAADVYEVEFSDDQGQTYAMKALKAYQLMVLHHKLIKLLK